MACRLEPHRHDDHIDTGNGRQQHIGGRNRYGENDKAPQKRKHGLTVISAPKGRHGSANVARIERADNGKTGQSAGNGTESGTGNGRFQAVRKERIRQDEHNAYADELIAHLRDRRRRHYL